MLAWLFVVFLTSSAENPVRRDLLPIEIGVTIPFLASASAIVNRNQWVCGANGASEILAHTVVANTCNEKMPEINLCCSMHDGCYENMLYNQTFCDGLFCTCLETVMTRTLHLPFSCFKIVTDGFCSLVRTFGDYAYGPKKPDNMAIPARHPAMNQTVIAEYNGLYGSCPGYRKFFATCAYNHLVCHLQMLPATRYDQSYEACRDDLIDCLHVSQIILLKNETETCDKQMKTVLKAISNDANESGIEVKS